MRRDVKILLVTLAAGSVWSSADYVGDALAEMETFKVADLDVLGLRYVDEEDIVRAIALAPGTSIWADTEVWEDRVSAHPMVKSARVRRRLPNRLRVSVSERQPVALAPTPTLEPVDEEGFRLPIDPAEHRLDLPVLSTAPTQAGAARMLPRRVRQLAAEAGRLARADTAFAQLVSEIGWTSDGALRLSWTEPSVTFVLHPGTPSARLMEGQAALADAAARTPGEVPEVVDLRFADQVVVRRAPEH